MKPSLPPRAARRPGWSPDDRRGLTWGLGLTLAPLLLLLVLRFCGD